MGEGSWRDQALHAAQAALVTGKVAANVLGPVDQAALGQTVLGTPVDPPYEIVQQQEQDFLGEKLAEENAAAMNDAIAPPMGGAM